MYSATTIANTVTNALVPSVLKRRIGNLAYKLELPPSAKFYPVVSVAQLEPAPNEPDPYSRSHNRTPQEIDADSGEVPIEYVHSILACRKSRGKMEYLVKWQNLGPIHNAWVKEEDLTHCREKIEAYEERRIILNDPDQRRPTVRQHPPAVPERTQPHRAARDNVRYNESESDDTESIDVERSDGSPANGEDETQPQPEPPHPEPEASLLPQPPETTEVTEGFEPRQLLPPARIQETSRLSTADVETPQQASESSSRARPARALIPMIPRLSRAEVKRWLETPVNMEAPQTPQRVIRPATGLILVAANFPERKFASTFFQGFAGIL